ncbi:MAG: hypothetical protein KDK78_07435, partial [Chlamydiia bacterium]|nr:hypothetical protein [Chlamydiia bacterium]
MTLNERLARCAVIGAAGKMGRGIALLLAQLCAEQGNCHLTLLDNNSDALEGLRSYLQTHLEKAEEKTGKQGLAERALAAIRFSSSYTDCKGCRLVFEAA